MLEVTPMAAEVINELTSQSEGTKDDIGLRFALATEQNSQAALELSLSEAVDGDEVVAAPAGPRSSWNRRPPSTSRTRSSTCVRTTRATRRSRSRVRTCRPDLRGMPLTRAGSSAGVRPVSRNPETRRAKRVTGPRRHLLEEQKAKRPLPEGKGRSRRERTRTDENVSPRPGGSPRSGRSSRCWRSSPARPRSTRARHGCRPPPSPRGTGSSSRR